MALTRAQILAEPAGPHLDRWVDEHVFGRAVRGRGEDAPDRPYALVGPGAAAEGFPDAAGAQVACPGYSTDLDAALRVAEQSISNIELRRIRRADGGWQWLAHLRFTEATGEAVCPALPLAICRAALFSKLGV